jgi:hypothetical protein
MISEKRILAIGLLAALAAVVTASTVTFGVAFAADDESQNQDNDNDGCTQCGQNNQQNRNGDNEAGFSFG